LGGVVPASRKRVIATRKSEGTATTYQKKKKKAQGKVTEWKAKEKKKTVGEPGSESKALPHERDKGEGNRNLRRTKKNGERQGARKHPSKRGKKMVHTKEKVRPSIQSSVRQSRGGKERKKPRLKHRGGRRPMGRKKEVRRSKGDLFGKKLLHREWEFKKTSSTEYWGGADEKGSKGCIVRKKNITLGKRNNGKDGLQPLDTKKRGNLGGGHKEDHTSEKKKKKNQRKTPSHLLQGGK